jgi:hypothetical protein|eukprot:COSAG01_NODE_40976_length_457_cov_0.865922_1_plen_52_part_00
MQADVVACVVCRYEKKRGAFKRISCFDAPGARRTVHVLYAGRMHYDALVVP